MRFTLITNGECKRIKKNVQMLDNEISLFKYCCREQLFKFLDFNLSQKEAGVNSKIIFKRTDSIWVLILYIIILGCSCKNQDQNNYQPVIREDWPVSTPQAEDLDPAEVEDLYRRAEGVGHLYSILLIKNGYLVAA